MAYNGNKEDCRNGSCSVCKNPKTQAHTEGKWIVGSEPFEDTIYTYNSDTLICIVDLTSAPNVGVSTKEVKKAIAHQIVREHNSHHELLEALKELVIKVEDAGWHSSSHMNALEAIKNAEEGK